MSPIGYHLNLPRIVVIARLAGDALRAAAARRRQRRETRQNHAALVALDDRTLHDLGFARSEISSIVANPDDPHRVRLMHSIRADRCVG